MKQIDDQRLEECREFFARPGPQGRTPAQVGEFVRDTLWALEELQFRRLQERVKVVPDPPKPYLLFGSDEAVLKFVEEKGLPDELWKQAAEEDVRGANPRSIHAVKLDGANESLWALWEETENLYKRGAA
jgi:hypothetical protein